MSKVKTFLAALAAMLLVSGVAMHASAQTADAAVAAFKEGKVLTCGTMHVSKEAGWSLSKGETYFSTVQGDGSYEKTKIGWAQTNMCSVD